MWSEQDEDATPQIWFVDEDGSTPIPIEEARAALEEEEARPANDEDEALKQGRVPIPTQQPKERAVLVGVALRNRPGLLPLEESLRELARLAETAGLEVVGQVTQKLNRPNPSTLVGKGKLEEIKALVEEKKADVVIFDEELTPRHQRELEKFFGEKVRVIDRTVLILDIFAQRAHTKEGALQVELAQLEYRLPRLTRAWSHLERQAGGGSGRAGRGGVGLRGPGEKQLELDRREIRKRIAVLKRELEKVRAHRQRYRGRRRKNRIPVVALVGYTNAGKSTLLNRLSGANVYADDKLFATLDPTTRRVELPGGHVALFTDTVGFIQKLPTTLVAAFRATLEEIAEADLLLHVIDISHPQAPAQAEAVIRTLREIHADHIPILTVLNKIDLLPDPEAAREAVKAYPGAVAISALTGEGIPELLQAVADQLYANYTPVEVLLPYDQGQLLSLFHEFGRIDRIEHRRDGVHIKGRLPGRLLARFAPFLQYQGRHEGRNLPTAAQTPIGEEATTPVSDSAPL
ncbi:MAG: GTPase HflX [Chloroflexi bacterium]|nr:GTPase HflX [Chloroflexota bacterium]